MYAIIEVHRYPPSWALSIIFCSHMLPICQVACPLLSFLIYSYIGNFTLIVREDPVGPLTVHSRF